MGQGKLTTDLKDEGGMKDEQEKIKEEYDERPRDLRDRYRLNERLNPG